jgi:hypothetical protein
VSLIAATWKSNHTASRRRIEGASKVWKKNHGKASMTVWRDDQGAFRAHCHAIWNVVDVHGKT